MVSSLRTGVLGQEAAERTRNMNKSLFPIVGLCQVCGNGTDETVGLTSADAPARTTEKVLLPLVQYKNMLVCERCKKKEQRKSISSNLAQRDMKEQRFLRNAGITETYE